MKASKQPSSSATSTGSLADAFSDAATDLRVEVLRAIARGHSISNAGRALGISYKAAWQAIDTLSNLSGQALVRRTVGGAGGGGAVITEEGLQMLELADALASAKSKVLNGFGHSAIAGTALGLRTSMRNQLRCEVLGCESSVSDEFTMMVDLGTQGGQRLRSSVTRESADLLGIREGVPVLVLCKATAVRVEPLAARGPSGGAEGMSSPQLMHDAPMNVLHGVVERRSAGAERDEIVLTMPMTTHGIDRWVGFASHERVLRAGQKVRALMPASALVLAACD